jgi:hypothetical protein
MYSIHHVFASLYETNRLLCQWSMAATASLRTSSLPLSTDCASCGVTGSTDLDCAAKVSQQMADIESRSPPLASVRALLRTQVGVSPSHVHRQPLRILSEPSGLPSPFSLLRRCSGNERRLRPPLRSSPECDPYGSRIEARPPSIKMSLRSSAGERFIRAYGLSARTKWASRHLDRVGLEDCAVDGRFDGQDSNGCDLRLDGSGASLAGLGGVGLARD